MCDVSRAMICNRRGADTPTHINLEIFFYVEEGLPARSSPLLRHVAAAGVPSR